MRDIDLLKYRAGDLSPEIYPYVSLNMLTTCPSRSSAARYFEQGEAAEPKAVLDYRDTSFTRQINQLVNESSSVHPKLQGSPDAFVFTANSAIPVADAIREYYDRSQLQQPLMTHIEANRITATLSFLNKSYPKVDLQNTSFPEDELKRLKLSLSNANHVCVVEQFVGTGRTISYASELLYRSGVRQVSAMRGRWYADARFLDIDKSSTTSKHSVFMREIGRKAFQLCL